ncbi:hypothetical protein MLD38_007386 [Melastoma candidum]|uniref:Uncharacterized protein n=1 Tax=Melastoma candidum TaxID=119954 RepID=A0ACB9RUR0_9MYRT|nr:hypothetical protein MLD38_007386 [Melastoma candidum]
MRAAMCNGTSVLGQLQPHLNESSQPHHEDDRRGHPTLEQMILQLEVEEELARKSKLLSSSAATASRRDDFGYMNIERGRMSCVTSSDVLRSARHALSQYPPRFSLDGKDAMYRSSFHRSVYVGGARPGRGKTSKNPATATACLPRWLGGQMVVWCEAGVVPKLMGLDKVPVVVRRRKVMARDSRGDKIVGRDHFLGNGTMNHKVVMKKELLS